MLRRSRRIASAATRRDICFALGFSRRSAELASEMYFLRNNFGAHPGGWRWWDHVEFLDDHDAARMARLAGRVLVRAAELEPQLRAIDPAPGRWSEWFLDNFDMLWDVVWFDRMGA